VKEVGTHILPDKYKVLGQRSYGLYIFGPGNKNAGNAQN
jgi:hypothetical protein